MKQKITINVSEIVRHTVILEMDEDEVNALVDDLDSSGGEEIAGDLCSSTTVDDVEWEIDDCTVQDITK
jgi:hypothetical protein